MTKSSDNQQPEVMTGESLDISEQRRNELNRIFPGIYTETTNEKGEIVRAIDFERLKAELGAFSDLYEGRRERYGMEWPGKRDCMRLIQEPSRATLKPVREESVDFDTTQNLFIEGDNLEVLKLLQKSYYGKVKMIYIDPPYNTGKEFIYPDKYSESLETYLAYAGLVDDEGKIFATNTASEGRFHTKWLNMMYPRLYLARNLLTEDGVIAVSIDDNEYRSLKSLLDEIYGEENFVCTFVWQRKDTPANDAKGMSVSHEYILLYAFDQTKFERNLLPRTEEQLAIYKNPDNDTRGPWTRGSLIRREGDYQYAVMRGDGVEVWPPKGSSWRVSPATMKRLQEENSIWWGADGKGDLPFAKKFLSEVQDGVVPVTWWDYKFAGSNRNAKSEIKSLFGGSAPFDTPKPTSLIKKLLQVTTDNDCLILDFFAGSASTADAVLQMNKDDNGKRRFIMVQLPEPLEGGKGVLSDIGKERIRRVINNFKNEGALQLQLGEDVGIDLGFKVLKLDRSTFKQWQVVDSKITAEYISQQLDFHTDHVDPYSTQEEVLYELLLKAGFMPTENIETLDLVGKKVFSVARGALLICLEDELTPELIDLVADREPMQFICLDKGFMGNDQLKANAVQTFKSRSQNSETEMVFKVV